MMKQSLIYIQMNISDLGNIFLSIHPGLNTLFEYNFKILSNGNSCHIKCV